LEEKRLWHSENKERLRPIKREREIREWNSNPIFRLKKLMSHRIRVSLKSSKDGKCLQDVLGYSVDELRNHLESKFYNGMTWDNYGEWHIDHIKPISSFNFSSYSEDEFRKCWNLDNLQPLWARDNLSKGARLSA
jgi:5-methylcytosine-specific restriction endonuclease McrA